MPGIVGIVSRKPAAECERMIAAMLESMRHETFYESGTCSAPEIGVFAGWMAHKGSMAARLNAAGRHHRARLVFSGECFRAADSETGADDLLDAYEGRGDNFVADLNGLFSGLVLDSQLKRALLFNDRYGAERIYFHEAADATYFASEAKALLRILPELRAFDDAGVEQFLAYGCALHWQTLFRGVRMMEGGSIWTIENGQCSKRRYFLPADWETQPPLTAKGFEAALKETLDGIMPRYLGGRDIGISLTGGLDSRMIVACLPAMQERPVCYTFSGLAGENLDERLAARVATACNLPHHTLRIGGDFLSNFSSYVDRTVYVTDGGSGATGAHEIYLNAQARHLAPVRVTGNFGSEVLRSVSTFKPVGLASQLFQADMGERVRRASRSAAIRSVHPVTFSAFREAPWHLFGHINSGKSQVTFRTPFLDNQLVALAFRAPAGCRLSPNAALHVIKSHHPALSSIPTDFGLMGGRPAPVQRALRLLSAVTLKIDYLYHEGMPHWSPSPDSFATPLIRLGLLGRYKWLPYRYWFRKALSPYVTEVITDARTSRLPYWDAGFLSRLVHDHVHGQRNYVREINAVLTLEAADRLIVRAFQGEPPGSVS